MYICTISSLLYFTELLNLPVFDLKGRRIGRLKDAAILPAIDATRIDRYLVGAGGAWLSIRYDQIASLSLAGIRLNDESLLPYHSDEYMLRINRDLLDQQIIDVDGRKVVRVNDVTFDIRHNTLAVLEVDIGIRSILRRVLQGIVPRATIRRLQAPIPPNSIRWEFCNIVEPDPLRRLRLNISNSRLEDLDPADLADIVEELGNSERESIFETIDSESAAEALSEVDPKTQASILEALEPEIAADIVEEMSPDEAADALGELEPATSEEILEEMETEPGTGLRELLEYPEDTAGGMMNTEYIALPGHLTTTQALHLIEGQNDLLETLNVILLIDSAGCLTGTVPLARVFLAQPGTTLAALTTEKLRKAKLSDRQDRVTELFDKYNILTLPIVDDHGKLAGVITADDIISVLRQK